MGKHITYFECKHTDVEWFPTVPRSWDVLYARRVFKQVREAAKPDDEQLAATQKYGVIPQRLFMEYQDQKVVLALSGTDNFKHVEIDDFVISLRSFQGGIERCHYEGCVSPAYTVMRRSKPIEPSYFSYLLKSEGFITALQAVTQGIREGKTITFDQFGSIPLPFPSHGEQQQIATFLDHETAKIDRLIARQQRLIELLKEKRQAVISHAVTKGLNPNAPMKDSGVEWLGEVPVHWNVGRIKNLALLISKGTTPTTVGGEFLSEGIRFLKAENISEGLVTEQPEFFINKETHIILSRSSLHDKDVLVVIAGATTGKAAVMPNSLLPANTNQAVSFIRLKDKRYAKFVARWMGTNFVLNHVWLNAVQAAQPNLSMEDLGNLPIVIPPAEELAALLEGLSSKLGAFDKLLEKTNTSIQLMQEHRTALISAAVTGKIDVRGWQKPNTEPQAATAAASA